jgi:peptidoglycan/xylan/chitin deacetylase (PgdA/CDA1 family)
MKREGKSRTVLKIAAIVVLLCVPIFTLVLSYQVVDLNRSLRTQVNVLNGLLTQQQAEISRLQERLAANPGASEAPGVPADDAAPREPVSGVWEPAPLRLWSEHRAYQEFYPSLYAERAERWFTRDRAVYLTFDDGPTIYTARVLDTLKENDVKATFFVVGNSIASLGEEGKALLRRMVAEGHTIGIHCNVHEYKRVYGSVAAFLEDFNTAFTMIYDITGVKPDIFRFPGGSVNNYNSAIRAELLDEMARRGFTYYDWNASSNDTSGRVTEESAWRAATARAGKSNRLIILMHETKEPTVNALPHIIDTYRRLGYNFARLTNIDKPITL